MVGGRFELIADPDFALRYRPARPHRRRLAEIREEIAGLITCAKCPAPKCGRWFPRSDGREDREYCCHACQMRAWQARGSPE
jgi:hypothetical protein